MALKNAFENLALDTTVSAINSTLNNGVSVSAKNVDLKLRETFTSYTPGVIWTEEKAPGDIIQLDGNSVGSSYITISKDPLNTGTESYITTTGTYNAPVEIVTGFSISQRTLGQESSIEFVSTDTPETPYIDVLLTSINQSSSNIYCSTATPHGLRPGRRISIYGCVPSGLNHPSLVVAAVSSSTAFSASAGPGFAIPSTTISGTTPGYVTVRSLMGGATDGTCQIFEGNSNAAASFYVRSDQDDPFPSGTIAGNQTITVASSSAVASLVAPGINSFSSLPSSEYKLVIQPDRLQWSDAAVDTTSAPTNRFLKTQLIPNTSLNYKLRFRATNSKSLTVPTAKIISATKTGTTTATIVTDIPHGLKAIGTVYDQVVVYGISNYTSFPNITTPTQISSVVDATTFTIVIGSAGSAVAYGGFVAKANGALSSATVPINAGMINTNWITASVTAGILRLTSVPAGGINSLFMPGDYVNVYGLVNSSTGASMELDGVYKAVQVDYTDLYLINIDTTPAPEALSSTGIGGTVLRRRDTRINFARIFNYARDRVEVLPRATNDLSGSIPVQGTVVIGSGTVTSVSTAYLAAPIVLTDVASTTITATVNTSTVTPSAGTISQLFTVFVTAVAGTLPILDIVIQESDDTGTNWNTIYQFPRITAIGIYRSPLIPAAGNRVRYSQTITGTGASFTRAINRTQSHASVPIQRQFFDYNILLNLSSATTSTFSTEGCVDLVVVASIGAVTTAAPVLIYEGSADAVNWYQVGADIITQANSTKILQISNASSRYSRVSVKTAGSGAALNYIMIKGTGY